MILSTRKPHNDTKEDITEARDFVVGIFRREDEYDSKPLLQVVSWFG